MINKKIDMMSQFENVIKVGDEKECAYCSNSAKYVTTTNLGWEQFVCALHLVQYGKQIDV
jgi:hypothetical protein